MTWVTRYQADPDFAVGQVALHDEPPTVPSTVTLLPARSRTLIAADVEVDVLRFTPSQAGARTPVAGGGGAAGEGAAAGGAVGA